MRTHWYFYLHYRFNMYNRVIISFLSYGQSKKLLNAILIMSYVSNASFFLFAIELLLKLAFNFITSSVELKVIKGYRLIKLTP